jgi:DNA-binding NarL/FixJ family response regulator
MIADVSPRLPYMIFRRFLGSLALLRCSLIRAQPWIPRARNELRATGAHRLSPAAAHLDELTAQQREIAELAAAGLTNKEISARLFLSARTVGNHLYQIFPKLGVTSRAALRDALSGHTPISDGPDPDSLTQHNRRRR